MAIQCEKVELWRNHEGDMIRRKRIAGYGATTWVVDNLSRRQRDWGWIHTPPAYDPRYSEYDAAKEAAKATRAPNQDIRDLLNLGRIFKYLKFSDVPLMSVIELSPVDGSISTQLVRPISETRLQIFFRWQASQAKQEA